MDEQAYVSALLLDLQQELPRARDRELGSIFIGGGTPSLFSGEAIARLLAGVRHGIGLVNDVEITLEANPGTADAASFDAYLSAGVNRLSLGIQSFDVQKLRRLGRIHSGEEARSALSLARKTGFENINLDIMFGLPDQSLDEAMLDLQTAIDLAPEHISWYQLTIEPNTRFYQHPPPTPHDDLLWDMQQAGQVLLKNAGYQQYEVSAYARGGANCAHNLNYWTFADYLGIGAGAHAKLTLQDRVIRRWKKRHPEDYMKGLEQARPVTEEKQLQTSDLVLEFMMNALRLCDGVPDVLLEQRTGVPLSAIEDVLQEAAERELLEVSGGLIRPTALGQTYLNDLLGLFSSE